MDVYVGTFNKKKASFGHCAMKIRKVLLTPLLGVGKSFVSCDLSQLSSSGLSWIRDVMTPAGHITTHLCTTPHRTHKLFRVPFPTLHYHSSTVQGSDSRRSSCMKTSDHAQTAPLFTLGQKIQCFRKTIRPYYKQIMLPFPAHSYTSSLNININVIPLGQSSL